MLRRILNVTVAGIALIVLAIPLLIVAIIIKLTSPGPALFRQQRVGKFGRQFDIFKFRTMIADASHQSGVTVGDDARVTPVGSFLRKTKIDELPQLINVLRGDMSLVGPRPELQEFVRKYSGCRPEASSFRSSPGSPTLRRSVTATKTNCSERPTIPSSTMSAS